MKLGTFYPFFCMVDSITYNASFFKLTKLCSFSSSSGCNFTKDTVPALCFFTEFSVTLSDFFWGLNLKDKIKLKSGAERTAILVINF
jgi:hypothetical protein